MHFYIQQEDVTAHFAAHTQGINPAIQRYCQQCCPVPQGVILSQPFHHFWNWFYTYHSAVGYTYFTYRAFQLYQERFQEPPPQSLTELSGYLISSICFSNLDCELWILCLTFHKTSELTQRFTRRVTSNCRQRVQNIIVNLLTQQALAQNPQNNQPNINMAASGQEIANALAGIFF